MLSTYDSESFSFKIKTMRKSMGFTVLDVSTSTGINQSTIKLMESGKTIPRFDTLKILSSFYKCDLVSIFNEDQNDSITMFLFNSLSTYAATNEIVELKNGLNLIMNHFNNDGLNPVHYRDLHQLQLFVEGLIYASQCSNSTSEEIDLSLDKYSKALSITISSFSFEKFQAYKYYSVEFNILFSAAVILGIKRECELSNRILLYVLEHFKSLESGSKIICILISKLYYVLAYNYHRMDEHQKALQYSVIGIEHCLLNDTHRYLPLLFGRKGVALHNLRKSEWSESINNAVVLLEIQGNIDLVRSFKSLKQQLEDSFELL